MAGTACRKMVVSGPQQICSIHWAPGRLLHQWWWSGNQLLWLYEAWERLLYTTLIIAHHVYLWNILLKKKPRMTRACPQKKKTKNNITKLVCKWHFTLQQQLQQQFHEQLSCAPLRCLRLKHWTSNPQEILQDVINSLLRLPPWTVETIKALWWLLLY